MQVLLQRFQILFRKLIFFSHEILTDRWCRLLDYICQMYCALCRRGQRCNKLRSRCYSSLCKGRAIYTDNSAEATSCLYRCKPALAQHENGHRTLMDDLLCYATQCPTCKACSSMAAQDNEIHQRGHKKRKEALACFSL